MLRYIKRLFLIGIFLIFLMLIWLGYEVINLPALPERLNRLDLSPQTIIYAYDGRPLYQVRTRTLVTLDHISPYFEKAVLAAEDHRFYDHDGIYKPGLVRAVLYRGKRGGGSTITQQLAKNLFLTFEKSFRRKLQDILLALQFERRYSKEEILEAYCNQVNFGSGAYGVENAAMTYFGKHASELDLTESVLLASLPQLPNYYNLYVDESRVKNRYVWILDNLRKLKWITDTEYEEASTFSFTLKNLLTRSSIAPHFIETVKKYIIDTYNEELLLYGGLRIYTTIDLELQEKAIQSVQEALMTLDARLGKEDYHLSNREKKAAFPEGALIALDHSTGAVRALVGGRDAYADYFNRAIMARRSPGSSFKPVVYLAAVEELGIDGTEVKTDSSVTYTIPGGEWTPQNFEDDFYGPVVLKHAIRRSINTIAAQLIQEVSPEKVIEMAEKLGVTTELEPVLSLALGSNGISAVELVSVYGTIASGGISRKPYFISKIEDAEGNILEENGITPGVRMVEEEKAYLIIDMLKAVVETGGTGAAVRSRGFMLPAGGKTGTTNDHRDAWFAGITPDITALAWVGYDNFEPMIDPNGIGITGASGALPVWTTFMKKIQNRLTGRDFPIPVRISFKFVDMNTGEETAENSENAIRIAVIQ